MLIKKHTNLKIKQFKAGKKFNQLYYKLAIIQIEV
jgi:hypothetical protein